MNLLCPLVLTRLVLPSLERLQGFVINIASGSPESARGGPAGASAAGGLRWMGEALFEECRGSGVKVTTIFPQANRRGPSQAGVQAESSHQTTIAPDAVAQAVERVVRASDGNVITEIVIRPQRLTEKPIPAPFLIPSPAIPREITPDRPISTLRALVETEEAITSAAKKARKASKEDPPKRSKSDEAKKAEESPGTKKKSALRKPPESHRKSKKSVDQTTKPQLSGESESKEKGKSPAKKSTRRSTKVTQKNGVGETEKRKSAISTKRKSTAGKKPRVKDVPKAATASSKPKQSSKEDAPTTGAPPQKMRSRRNQSPVPRTRRRKTPGPSS